MSRARNTSPAGRVRDCAQRSKSRFSSAVSSSKFRLSVILHLTVETCFRYHWDNLLVDTFPPAKRASAFAVYTAVIVTAPTIGPVLGGWITDNYDWRWIFFINIPIGFLAFFLCSRVLKDPPAFETERAAIRNGRFHVDGTGIALIAIASASLEVALRSEEHTS